MRKNNRKNRKKRRRNNNNWIIKDSEKYKPKSLVSQLTNQKIIKRELNKKKYYLKFLKKIKDQLKIQN